ncbi:MAG: T9SS type A sorting domain-containing protein [Bacteroidales bacterium]|nr:T9SS type A sorting domain-containing protein [Bacteroidales bacterium]
MRKILLLSAALLISVGIMAQNAAPKKVTGVSNKYQKVQTTKLMHGNESTQGHILKPTPTNKDAQAISKVMIGSSYNIYTALVSESAGLTANPETGVIAMVHRSNKSDGSGSGNIYVSFSSDQGFTWDSTTVKTWSATTYPGRYPGVAIYNPTGNTTAASAFAVTTGPILTSAGSGWTGNYFTSMQFDGSNGNFQNTFHEEDTAGGTGNLNNMARIHLQARGNKFFVLGDDNKDDGTYYTNFNTIVNAGTWDATGDSIIWARYLHTPDYIVNSSSGNEDGYSNPGLVMADDGLTGYLVYIGRDGDATDNLTFQPLIYKTTDGGANWTKQAAFDWSAITVISDLASDLSGVGRPSFGSVKDITLDEDGYVHFISYINGAYSDNVDSLGYYNVYSLWNGIVCDVHQTATGWDAFVVDTVYTADPDETTTLISTGTADALSWDERFQMSTTPDRSKIFYAWMDTDTILSPDNVYPDIYVKMYDVATATLYDKVNLTQGTTYDANNYWMYFSDVTFDLTNSYQLHITTSDLNTNDAGPVNHYYMTGVILDETGQLTTGVEDYTLQGVVSLYPNPTSDNINLSFNESGEYNVAIYNTLGSIVSNEVISVNGTSIQTISLENLPMGVYMVEISNDNGSMTQKVVKN